MRDVRVIQNFIAGEFCGPQDGELMDNINPATGSVLSRFPRSKAADMDAAVQAAQEAMAGEWGQWSAERRADLLDAVAEKITERFEELVEIESLDTGKPRSLARAVDIPRARANFRFFAGAIRHQSTGCHIMGTPQDGAVNYTLRKPVGVAGLITPWNLPLYLLSWKVAPALAMGNTIVAKPSELTPMSASVLAEILDEVGLPSGVFNLVHGIGPEAGQRLVEHEDVSLISFTGGTQTGKRVAATAAPLFKKLSLELGGKNPTIVFADAQLDVAVEQSLRASFANQGQICLCGSRILVQAEIYDEFEKAFVEKAKAMAVGDPALDTTQVGALISQGHLEKVESYIELAKQEGGRVLAGGKRPRLEGDAASGAFLEPTVIGGLSPTCRTATEEIFGPVVTLHKFETEEEAIEIANGVRYGLSASVWTSNLSRAHRVSAELDTGMVWVNTWLLRDLRVPFGGMKDSGVGREGGDNSLEFYSESRNICIRLDA